MRIFYLASCIECIARGEGDRVAHAYSYRVEAEIEIEKRKTSYKFDAEPRACALRYSSVCDRVRE